MLFDDLLSKQAASDIYGMAKVVKRYGKDDGESAQMPGQQGRLNKAREWRIQLSLSGSAPVWLRRLRSKELVTAGDYVKDDEGKYEPWEGPRGFQAASFCREVYRPEGKN
jgi:hypothetical protein